MKGSTAADVFGTVYHLAASVAINALIFPHVAPRRYITSAYSSRLWTRSFFEFCIIILPFLVLITSCSIQIWLNIAVVGSLLLQLYLFIRDPQSQHVVASKLEEPYVQGRQTVITNFRGAVNLATCICILAVDFQIFPEKFSKTFKNGYGLMDVGVGCFVFANGLTGIDTRISGSFGATVQKALKTSVPLLALGLMRLISVAATGYHYNVEEYGLHWNFFFTLGFIKILGPIISALFPIVPPWAKAVCVACGYEAWLMSGLRSWILSEGSRTTLLEANREGIYSLCGYLAIYWLSIEVGRYLNSERRNIKEWTGAVATLASWGVGFWLLTEFVARIEGPPSRRLADLGYVLWMGSFNLLLMSTLFIADIFIVMLDKNSPVSDDKGSSLDLSKDFTSVSSLPLIREPYIYKAINYNGLLFFLLSNVITGLVNMLIDTHHVNDFVAFIVLNGYVLVICVFALTMYLWRLRLKFW